MKFLPPSCSSVLQFLFCNKSLLANSKKLICTVLLFFTFQLVFAQNSAEKIEEIKEQYKTLSNLKGSEYEKKVEELIKSSSEINYTDGIVNGKIKLMLISYNQSDFGRLLELTRETDAIKTNNYEHLSMISFYKSYANKALGIEREQIQNIKDALKYAKLIEEPDKRHQQIATVYNQLANFYDYKSPDSLIYYLKKEAEELNKITEENPKTKIKKYSTIALNSINIGNYYLGVIKPQRLDLAEPYYLTVYNYKTTRPEIFAMYDMPILCGTGRFYMEKGEYNKAIEIANEVLEIEKLKKNPVYKQYAYQLIADSNEGLKNTVQQAKFTKLYAKLSDSLNKESKKEVSQQFEQLVTEVEKKKDEEHNSNFNFFLLVVIGAALITGILLLFYIKRKKAKYEELIVKIKSEKTREETVTEPEIATESQILFINNILEESASVPKEKSSAITDATVHIILSKLHKFERSDKYLKNEISLSYLASQLGTNTKYLSEIIKQHKEKSFSNYINGLRINYIAALLYNDPKYREYKISYLAELSGFSSREVFAVVFKKETGVSPSYFIDNLKNENQLT